ncbi:MAG TPA: FtsX-like permease family protein [Planctomycetota bacterium]|nr:FtsX-like permease family protein [Planctomycetota bacterium]
MSFYKLVWRNLLDHKLRSLLTIASLVVAMFLLCTLRSLVTTLTSNVSTFDSRRLWVQSAVSLFVDMPLSYQPRINAVDGVERTCKWQWFGGYYKDPSNFFGQFAVDPEELLETCPEIEITEGSADEFLRQRTGCIIGAGLARSFGWKVGDRVPLIGALFPHPDGAEVAWEFDVVAIYRPGAKNWDDRTLFFRWDYFEETVRSSRGEPPGFGTMVIRMQDGSSPEAIMAEVDAMFANGPQRTQTTTEAEFQRQFLSMFGNIPFFVSSIGGGVLLAILLACVNTMLMAGREQTHDVGILKALGFEDGDVFKLLLGQSLLLCLFGGGAGILLALGLEPIIAEALGASFPGFTILQATALQALATAAAVGLVAGLVPAWRARALVPVEALRSEE